MCGVCVGAGVEGVRDVWCVCVLGAGVEGVRDARREESCSTTDMSGRSCGQRLSVRLKTKGSSLAHALL